MAIEIVVARQEAGKRLDQILTSACPGQSRGTIQKAIKTGCCQLNEQPALNPAQKLKPGQIIAFSLPQVQNTLKPGQNDLEIIWQDEHLAVINKPFGLTVHPCPSCQEETLVHKLLAHFPQLAQQDGDRPGIVHRLDKDTSGLIAIALTEKARLALTEAFSRRQIRKEYLALVAGSPSPTGESLAPLGRHPTIKTRMAIVPENHGGRPAHSRWRKLWQGKNIALLAVQIFTGRTHQIRVHLVSQHWPLIGDAVYAPTAIASMAPRQMLHAWRLEFTHPVTGENLHFLQPLPNDFLEIISEQENFWLPIVATGNQGCGKSAFCNDLAQAGFATISADAIVASLYAGKSAATDWIATHLGPEMLTEKGAVNKQALFALLKKKPHLRPELEKVAHGLVAAQIASFWSEQEKQGKDCAVAEIPLYFESDLQKYFNETPYVVGISCPQELRWQRIMANRHWSRAKTELIESWQWPESKKMAACDEVIANNGTEEQLQKQAADFARRVQTMRAEMKEKMLADILRLTS